MRLLLSALFTLFTAAAVAAPSVKADQAAMILGRGVNVLRSEERRVGKEC